jgi:hypothetical protein
MKYYILNYSTDKSEIGYYPQTGGYYPEYDIHGNKSMINLKSDCFPDFIPDLRFILDKRAKITDIIKPSNINKAKGLLMNQRTKDLLSLGSFQQSAFYNAIVENQNAKISYYWLHILSQSFDNIDFNKSIFFTTKLAFKKDINIDIYDEVDLKNKIKSLNQLILVEKLVLKKEFLNSNNDIFYFPLIQGNFDFFISDKLAEIITNNRITGIALKEQNIICCD